MTPRGRPKHVDRGTTRRPFTWLGAGEPGPTTRYCTVTWMRHGSQVAAVATYRNVGGLDVQWLGMAQGAIDGPLSAIGDDVTHSVRALLGRPPTREIDGIEACVILAIRSLECAVDLASRWGEDGGEHPWTHAGRGELAAQRYKRRQSRKVGA